MTLTYSELDRGLGRAWETARGRVVVKRPAPTVVHFIEEGHLCEAFAAIVARVNEEAFDDGAPLHIFVDAWAVQSFDPGFRVAATEWLERHRERVAVQHMLVRSRLTRMGLSASRLAVNELLRGYDARDAFAHALTETLADPRQTGVRYVGGARGTESEEPASLRETGSDDGR